MFKESTVSSLKNIGKNWVLLLSTVIELCLFLTPSIISVLLTAAILAVLIEFASFDSVNTVDLHSGFMRGIQKLTTLLISFAAFYSFVTTWVSDRKIRALASSMGITPPRLLHTAGFIGCIVGLYAVYVWSRKALSFLEEYLKEKLPVQEKSLIFRNILRNFYFTISALAFYTGWYLRFGMKYFFPLLIAFLATFFFSSQIHSFWKYTLDKNVPVLILSLASTAGICLFYNSIYFYIASYYIYFCILVIWRKLFEFFSTYGIFRGIKPAEWVIYALILAFSLGMMAYCFTGTQAFYGTGHNYDIIYTGDSPNLVRHNVYLLLNHGENDLRQPLFAVFAAPFSAIPWLAAKLTGASLCIQSILMNSAQILMLFAANIMLAKMLRLGAVKRICFIILLSCTYTQFLFTLMMEQYVVAYFWLIFAMYVIIEKKQPDRLALFGAGGTLLTGMILLPFMTGKSMKKDFKGWFSEAVRQGTEFIALLLMFCRFDVLSSLNSQISMLNQFTGRTVTFSDKINQYTGFLRNLFIAPSAGANDTAVGYMSWQLNPVEGISIIGLVILLISIVSFVINRTERSSKTAAGWIGMSVLMLFILGWGTQENGLILYSLYFGWAFLSLIFQLFEKIEDKLKIKYLIPVVSLITAALLLWINIPAVKEMVQFGITYYPA